MQLSATCSSAITSAELLYVIAQLQDQEPGLDGLVENLTHRVHWALDHVYGFNLKWSEVREPAPSNAGRVPGARGDWRLNEPTID